MRTAFALTTFVVLIVGVYALSCWWFPFGACLWCKGQGRHMRADRKVHRPCWWCKGSGRRRRIGRIIYDRFHGGRT